MTHDERLDVGSLEQPARDPYDGVVSAEAGVGSVRVGRLGVVDVVDAVDGGDPLVSVWPGAVGPQAFSDSRPGDGDVAVESEDAGDGGGGERVGDVVRPGHAEVVYVDERDTRESADRRLRLDAGCPPGHPVDDDPVDHAEATMSGLGNRERMRVVEMLGGQPGDRRVVGA